MDVRKTEMEAKKTRWFVLQICAEGGKPRWKERKPRWNARRCRRAAITAITRDEHWAAACGLSAADSRVRRRAGAELRK